ncbi:hypothetical protein [Egicoccus sp. AB-alg2]|uniref:hypothetical protein n=1 Tax=Egicoccus sp. AB-alg2 TaxID=3242693 RepID=UPI00359EA545
MRNFLLVLHILLLVAWLGIDVGVFTSSFFIRRRGLSGDARVELRRLMRGLDLAPRLSLVLMIPVGLGLADVGGYAQVPTWVLAPVTIIGIAWAGLSVWSFRRLAVLGSPDPGRAPAGWFRKLDLWLRLVAVAGFMGFGAASLVGASDVFPADFVAIKAVMFGTLILAGLRIRSAAAPFTPALRSVVEEGEAEEQLVVMDQAMRRVYPAVLYIWGGLVVMTFVAVFRPTLG